MRVGLDEAGAVSLKFGAKNGLLGPLAGGGKAWVGLIMSQRPGWLETGARARQGSKEQELEF